MVHVSYVHVYHAKGSPPQLSRQFALFTLKHYRLAETTLSLHENKEIYNATIQLHSKK